MDSNRPITNIALIGFMGTGKSSVGRILAQFLRFDFIDTDALLEARAGRTVAEIFSQEGESRFRELEREIVGELAKKTATVIATGGGLGAEPANVAQLKTHALVACLWASPELIFERVHRQTHRPLLATPDPLSRIRELLSQREQAYKLADILISTEFRSPREVAQHVLHEFESARR